MSTPKRKRSRAFESTATKQSNTIYDSESGGGVFGFFRDFGVRETIESIIIAVVLALMFRTYEAEAFIIPTGSMAPTLQGQHMDVYCKKCDYKYRTGASNENSTIAPADRDPVTFTFCPICNYEMRMRRFNNDTQKDPDHTSNNGDRILVNKFIYDMSEPKRFDVIVFKNPNNGKQNYIKRLIGLPGETLRIENGDVFLIGEDGSKSIIRKPAGKVRVMLQLVDDTDYIAEDLDTANWPLRWQQWAGGADGWKSQSDSGAHKFYLDPGEKTSWLSYRHLRPRADDWRFIENRDLPPYIKNDPLGQLITDYYCYNDFVQQLAGSARAIQGAHWVGDLAMECKVTVSSNTGTLALKLVEGGTDFVCNIDVETGQATLGCNNEKVVFLDESANPVAKPTAKTNLKGAGTYNIIYANVDDQILLWVNNRLASFDAPLYLRDEIAVPKWSTANAGDAEPLAVGGKNIGLTISRLQVKRDIYYTSVGGTNRIPVHPDTRNETGFDFDRILNPIFTDPNLWDTPEAMQVFTKGKGLNDPMFFLQKDQFLPMGDNSPASSDGRVWDGPRFLDRDYLIGRAMMVYWPHTLNKPIPYFPNFGRMGFIR